MDMAHVMTKQATSETLAALRSTIAVAKATIDRVRLLGSYSSHDMDKDLLEAQDALRVALAKIDSAVLQDHGACDHVG
jgi:hypothetical protein